MNLRVLKRREVVSALTGKLRIELVHNRESVGWLVEDGIRIIRFSLPGEHGGKSDLSPGACAKLLKESHLSRADFADLIDCPLKRDGYLQRLEAKGLCRPKE